jgi:hypothetical protein
MILALPVGILWTTVKMAKAESISDDDKFSFFLRFGILFDTFSVKYSWFGAVWLGAMLMQAISLAILFWNPLGQLIASAGTLLALAIFILVARPWYKAWRNVVGCGVALVGLQGLMLNFSLASGADPWVPVLLIVTVVMTLVVLVLLGGSLYLWKVAWFRALVEPWSRRFSGKYLPRRRKNVVTPHTEAQGQLFDSDDAASEESESASSVALRFASDSTASSESSSSAPTPYISGSEGNTYSSGGENDRLGTTVELVLPPVIRSDDVQRAGSTPDELLSSTSASGEEDDENDGNDDPVSTPVAESEDGGKDPESPPTSSHLERVTVPPNLDRGFSWRHFVEFDQEGVPVLARTGPRESTQPQEMSPSLRRSAALAQTLRREAETEMGQQQRMLRMAAEMRDSAAELVNMADFVESDRERSDGD